MKYTIESYLGIGQSVQFDQNIQMITLTVNTLSGGYYSATIILILCFNKKICYQNELFN
jgi:hypothetical protein